jgi:hypothetical protein
MMPMSLWTRSSQRRLLSNHANFGSGTLVVDSPAEVAQTAAA